MIERLEFDMHQEKATRIIEKLGINDEDLRSILLEFSSSIMTGCSHHSYKLLQSIKDEEMWKEAAKFCVLMELLDWALFCCGHTNHACTLNFAKSFFQDAETEAKLAAIAIHLGLFEEAEMLYMKCKRYDLLNWLHQASGCWESSLDLASKDDRLNLKNSHYNFANHLQAIGEIQTSINHYEMSDTHRCEVPRMLHSMEKIDELHRYVDKKKDPHLQRWWAGFCESNEDLQEAIDYYKLVAGFSAGDALSLLRIHCKVGDFANAETIVTESSSPAAYFYLGQQYEKLGKVQQALQFYSKAGKHGFAAHLAMKHGIDSELLSLSLQSCKEIMQQAANYFEEKSMNKEAVLLYQKTGDMQKAIDICIKSELFDAFKAIADNLDEGTDPALLLRCGDFLLQHQQFDKAVIILIAAKKYLQALDLCIEKKVAVTEEIIDLFAKKVSDDNLKVSDQFLTQIAEFCESQSSYQLACKTYIHAGDKVRAMKALIKSRDTERILLFANVSRQMQLYILAADYLMALDWQHEAEIMRQIVHMYTKAADMESLALFYEKCARFEIDEFCNYENALGAMKEALKVLSKVKGARSNMKVLSLESRIDCVEKFVQAQKMAKTDPNGMLCMCSQLLSQLPHDEGKNEAAVRSGDLYALLIEFHFSQGDTKHAYDMVMQMKNNKVDCESYVDPSLLQKIMKVMM